MTTSDVVTSMQNTRASNSPRGDRARPTSLSRLEMAVAEGAAAGRCGRSDGIGEAIVPPVLQFSVALLDERVEHMQLALPIRRRVFAANHDVIHLLGREEAGVGSGIRPELAMLALGEELVGENGTS